jgi:hypothetical protein
MTCSVIGAAPNRRSLSFNPLNSSLERARLPALYFSSRIVDSLAGRSFGDFLVSKVCLMRIGPYLASSAEAVHKNVLDVNACWIVDSFVGFLRVFWSGWQAKANFAQDRSTA